MTVNGNLSQQQIGKAPAMTKVGAMPIQPKFDGPAPIKEASQRGVMQPNVNRLIPKPGFF
jgi:hypothetical protein